MINNTISCDKKKQSTICCKKRYSLRCFYTPLLKKLCGDEWFVMESTAPKIIEIIIESDQTERIPTSEESSSSNSIHYCNGINLSSLTVIVDKEKKKRREKKWYRKKFFPTGLSIYSLRFIW